MLSTSLLLLICALMAVLVGVLLYAKRAQAQHMETLQRTLNEHLAQMATTLQNTQIQGQHTLQEHISKGHLTTQQLTSETVQRQMVDIREQMTQSFKQHAESLTSHLQSLLKEVRHHLKSLSDQVNNRLNEGFEKTSSTFTDIVRRLAIIDEAQKKITELSSHVINLQDILTDKRSRGAFGEVQLSTLISNMLPPAHYAMQFTLGNKKRVDCVLFLPEPTGSIAIDAKFPLETYQKLMGLAPGSLEKKALQQQFRQDLQKHLKDIAEKYIVPEETTDGAMMFVPAEAIFAEIHANYPDIVSLSQRLKVWMVSPSTLMAVLTTARAVLKDDATRKQVHIIQKHLQTLALDFQRFDKRMDKLSRHISQANTDVSEVNASAKKITQRFKKIESVELEHQDTSALSSPLPELES